MRSCHPGDWIGNGDCGMPLQSQGGTIINAVGIDVSKGTRMMAALSPMDEVKMPPREYPHTNVGLERMAYDILALGEDAGVITEPPDVTASL